MILRPATMADAQRLFDWRNDALTRAMSRSAAPVAWSDHLRWLGRRLSHEPPHLYIAELRSEPIGTFRIDGDEISYTIAPEYRGRGYAVAMLRSAREAFGVKRAEIFRRNAASIKAAANAGHFVVLLDELTASDMTR